MNLFSWVINFGHDIIGLVEAPICKYDGEEAVGISICLMIHTMERVSSVEIVWPRHRLVAFRLEDPRITNESSDDDQQKHKDLDAAQEVHQVDATSAPESMEETSERHNCDGDTANFEVVFRLDVFTG